MIESLDKILKRQDEFDEYFWRLVALATITKNREILKIATGLDILYDSVFWSIAEHVKTHK